MKKIIFLTVITLTGAITNAQPAHSETGTGSPFMTAMQKNIRSLDTASNELTWMNLGNNFERIGKAEKTKWEPFYFAAYTYTVMAYMSPDKSKIDGYADKAESFLQQAETLDPNNSEISCLFAMINSCRILVDPVSRFQTKGKEVHDFLTKAKTENPENPRIYLLQARMQLRTPEAFGGGLKIARESVEKAIVKFDNFIPADILSPAWGKEQAGSLLEKMISSN